VGPRAVNRGENLNVFVITNIENDGDEASDSFEELTLSLEGERFGDIEEKTLQLNFRDKQVTFNVSSF
jgi:hypothetical protein